MSNENFKIIIFPNAHVKVAVHQNNITHGAFKTHNFLTMIERTSSHTQVCQVIFIFLNKFKLTVIVAKNIIISLSDV